MRSPQEKPVDLIVLGAGPAGISAALNAARHGVGTLLIEEAPAPGGQIYRALPAAFAPRNRTLLGEDFAKGEALRSALASSDVEVMLDHRVWNVAPGFLVQAVHERGSLLGRSRSLISATGVSERVFPFPGWTMPGVIGLAGATILLRSQQILPGRRTIVCGVGPLLYNVAAGILKAGGGVAAVVDAASLGEWFSSLPGMMARSDLAARGAAWIVMLRRKGVPIFFRSKLLAVRGKEAAEEAVIGPVDAEGRKRAGGKLRSFSIDSVAVGHGLVPGTEVARLLKARQEFRPERGGWIAEHDIDGRTSVERFYVAGDGAGIAGGEVAEHSGALAGLAAAYDLGKLDAQGYAAAAAPVRRRLQHADRFGAAMALMMRARPGLIDAATAETVVCRCEDVTRDTIETTIQRGARTLNELKSWTRCGMGPCQGRFCAETAAELIAVRTGDRVGVGQLTARLPIRPVPVRQLVQDFDYETEVPPPALVPL